MKKKLWFVLLSVLISCKSNTDSAENTLEETNAEQKEHKAINPQVNPIQHASFVMNWGSEVFYFDPVGGAETFKDQPKASLILITDIHGDHFNLETLQNLPQTFQLIAPDAVYTKLSDELKAKTKVLNNNEEFEFKSFKIKAIPMYNMTEERKNFHEKGRGNGYVISSENLRVYISGDTEDIPEMRQLENIDIAFVCMNLPYTMDIKSAADAVLEFQPTKVIPYHYRGRKEGETYYHDVEEFKSIINSNSEDIEVELLNWYPERT
jgi:L-ascorbate metabolism protein UlaG (beta-lactamase superfamily)